MTGRELKIKRVTADLQQWDIAKICNVSQAQVSVWERGLRTIPKEAEEKIKEVVNG